ATHWPNGPGTSSVRDDEDRRLEQRRLCGMQFLDCAKERINPGHSSTLPGSDFEFLRAPPFLSTHCGFRTADAVRPPRSKQRRRSLASGHRRLALDISVSNEVEERQR